MAGYRSRIPTELAWDETRRHLDTDLRDITALARNQALTALDRRFNDNLQEGTLKALRLPRAELKALVADTLSEAKLTDGKSQIP
jgi:hypothetical protein